MADAGSKLHLCSDQYGLNKEEFLDVQEFFGRKFTVDGFASALSKKTIKFIAPCPQTGAIDTDFFSSTLSETEFYYLHPPPKMLNRLVEKLVCYKNVKGIIILPMWKSHSFWMTFVKQGRLAWFIKNFLIFSPEYEAYSKNSMFQGKKVFDTLAVEFDTSNKYNLKFSD